MSGTASNDRQTADQRGSDSDFWCSVPHLPQRRSFFWRFKGSRVSNEASGNRRKLKCSWTAFRLYLTGDHQAGKSLFQRKQGWSSLWFSGRLFYWSRTTDTTAWGNPPMHSGRRRDQRWCKPGATQRAPHHPEYQWQNPRSHEQPVKQFHNPLLSAGCSDHYAKRPLLSAGQSRIQRTGSRHDPRSVFYRFHTVYWADVRCKIK